jgi:hypothetical protein
MTQPLASNNDPSPEKRKGDSSFLPVVVAFVVTILVLLAAAVIYVKVRQTKTIPHEPDPHPTSQVWQSPTDVRVVV